jgi:hypothetical protein
MANSANAESAPQVAQRSVTAEPFGSLLEQIRQYVMLGRNSLDHHPVRYVGLPLFVVRFAGLSHSWEDTRNRMRPTVSTHQA